MEWLGQPERLFLAASNSTQGDTSAYALHTVSYRAVSSQIKQTEIPSCRAENLSISFSSPQQILTSLALEKMHKEPPPALSSSWGAARISARFQGVTEQKPAQHAHLLKLSLSFCFHRLALPCIPPAQDASLATAAAAVNSRRSCFIQHQLPRPQHWQLLFSWFLSDLSSPSYIPPSGPPPKGYSTTQDSAVLFQIQTWHQSKNKK